MVATAEDERLARVGPHGESNHMVIVPPSGRGPGGGEHVVPRIEHLHRVDRKCHAANGLTDREEHPPVGELGLCVAEARHQLGAGGEPEASVACERSCRSRAVGATPEL